MHMVTIAVTVYVNDSSTLTNDALADKISAAVPLGVPGASAVAWAVDIAVEQNVMPDVYVNSPLVEQLAFRDAFVARHGGRVINTRTGEVVTAGDNVDLT